MDHYAVLGVSFGASDVEIRSAYRAMALRYHPDKNIEQRSQAEVRFKLLHEAYHVLSDPERRRKYDATYAHRSVKVRDDDVLDVEVDEFGVRVHDMAIHRLADLAAAFEPPLGDALDLDRTPGASCC